jgi:ABC-type cobalamin/Fe3+-siderophores transport system ATPase subunit
VAIAHGIARAPRLLLVDDPTANLGLLEREEVMALLRELVEETNLAVLMTVPDMPAAMHSHQLRALSGGRLLRPPQPSADNVIDLRGATEFSPSPRLRQREAPPSIRRPVR